MKRSAWKTGKRSIEVARTEHGYEFRAWFYHNKNLVLPSNWKIQAGYLATGPGKEKRR